MKTNKELSKIPGLSFTVDSEKKVHIKHINSGEYLLWPRKVKSIKLVLDDFNETFKAKDWGVMVSVILEDRGYYDMVYRFRDRNDLY